MRSEAARQHRPTVLLAPVLSVAVAESVGEKFALIRAIRVIRVRSSTGANGENGGRWDFFSLFPMLPQVQIRLPSLLPLFASVNYSRFFVSIRQSRHLRYFAGQSWEACEDGGMAVKTEAQNQKSEGKIEERGGSVAPIDNRLYRRLATSSVCRQSRIRASADYQSAISRLEVGTASWRYDAERTRSAGGPNPEIAQVCPGLPGFDRLWPGKVSSVRRAGCGRIPVNRESANTAIYCAKPCVPISNQPIRSHINLMNFLPAMPIFHNLCL